MNKTYHFMAGLPRSGSTALSAILNQNPEVYSSPHSELITLLYNLESQIPTLQSYQAGLMTASYKATLHRLTDTFYSTTDKPVVIDKNRGWGTPYNWNNLSHLVNPEGKVILTMRPILEVLGSFVRVIKNNQVEGGRLPYLDDSLWVSQYRAPADAVVDGLMVANGEIDKAIFSIANLLQNHKDKVHIVWFQDLIETPEATLNGVYDFLELDKFQHNFNKIESADTHNDLAGYGLKGLHDVKKKLTKPTTKPEDYLSDYVIQKYGNALNFLGLGNRNPI